jgi:hypothetical protein
MRISSGENDVPQCVLAITINENISHITVAEKPSMMRTLKSIEEVKGKKEGWIHDPRGDLSVVIATTTTHVLTNLVGT